MRTDGKGKSVAEVMVRFAGDCRGQFEELTMCQDGSELLEALASSRWKDHCVAHEIFHHVK